MQPRLIRLRDAPKYLGMDRNRFNSEVRPYLVTLKIGQQGIAFDRIDLDHWVDQFKKNEGIPAQKCTRWHESKHPPLIAIHQASQPIRKLADIEFKKILDRLLSKKPTIRQ
jgi:hypothetical protein